MSKAFIVTLAVLTTSAGLIIGGMKAAISSADTFNISPVIIQAVKHQGEVLDNHEARITNTENDVKSLQVNTNTAPPTERTDPPSVITPKIELESAASPILVIEYSTKIIDDETTDCILTYSDNTTLEWTWKKITYNQGTKITSTNGICDKNILGTQKTS